MPIARSALWSGSTYIAPPPPPEPAWRAAITSGQWGIAGSSLSASGVMHDFGGGAGVFPWSGGVLNTVGVYVGDTFIGGTFAVLFGGGHDDYGGNELYAFGPLEADAPAWYRLRDRTSPFPLNVSQDGSGNPVSRHSYNSLVYIGGGRNWLLSAGGLARHNDADGIAEVHVYRFGIANPNASQPWLTRATGPEGMFAAVYEEATDKVWGCPISNGRVAVYDVAADTWDEDIFKSPISMQTGGCSALDQARGLFAVMNTSTVQFYRTNNGTSNDYYTPSMTGTVPTGMGGLVWDPVIDKFVRWNGNGRELHYLSPPASNPYQGGNAWTWSSVTPGAGSTPDAQRADGTYGRFMRVGGALHGYLLLNGASGSVYFFKP